MQQRGLQLSNFAKPCNAGGFDVAVIGTGVVGCATARRFALAGARTVIIEKAPEILAGASKGNSAILHTGFDAKPGSIEVALMQEGRREYLAIRESLNLPLLETDAIVAAWSESDLERLPEIVAQAHANGCIDVQEISAEEIRRREPNLCPDVLGGVLVPGEHVIDPWSAPLAYLRQALDNGAVLRRATEVTGGAFDGRGWTLRTTTGDIPATTVVNCAGVHGDIVEARLLGAADFRIDPLKGQFVVFDKIAACLVDSIILPVPTARTKGVLIARTIFGNVLVGPTADPQEDRDRAAVDAPTLRRLIERACEIIPALRDVPVTATYAGLRPATETKEYRIAHDAARNYLRAGAIRSTGLTSALGVAAHLHRLYAASEERNAPLAEPVCRPVPNLAEHAGRDWQNPGTEIVCHCELVTRREIEQALGDILPPATLAGLKRRTRAGLGRCQGFYCAARVAGLAQGRLSATPSFEPVDG